MFKCKDCGYVFTSPIITTERHGFDYGPAEHFEYCPNCKNDRFEEAIHKYGDYYTEDELIEMDEEEEDVNN